MSDTTPNGDDRADNALPAESPETEQQSQPTPPQDDAPGPADDHQEEPMKAPAPDADKPSRNEHRQSGKRKPLVVVRYGLMRHIGQFTHNLDKQPSPGAKVVVRTPRGVELGEILTNVCDDCSPPKCIGPKQLADYIKANDSHKTLRREGKVLRLANHQDLIDQRHLNTSADEAAATCRQLIREMKLDMRLVSVEHLLGGERLVFHFTAENRVDFRELVHKLAGQYHTRIEMRQVGARDEARLVADYERCGQRCCCQQYLKELQPVSMRMAKVQKATLDPSKISGRCGRLMCCLRYEDETYSELKKLLPKKNTFVRTADHHGRVVDAQIITQLVRLQLADRTFVAVANEEIIDRNAEPFEEAAPSEPRSQRKERDRSQMRPLREETVPETSDKTETPAGDDKQTPADDQSKKSKRRRRRSKKRRPGGTGQPQQQGQPQSSGGQNAPSGGDGSPSQGQSQQGSSSKKRRRRRKKKK